MIVEPNTEQLTPEQPLLSEMNKEAEETRNMTAAAPTADEALSVAVAVDEVEAHTIEVTDYQVCYEMIVGFEVCMCI